MNRAERRKQAKQINTPSKIREVVDLALEEQRKRLLQQFYREKIDLVNTMMIMVSWTLHNKLDLGKKRLPKIISQILFDIDAYNTGHLNSDDFEYITEEMKKYGIEMKENGGIKNG